MQDALATALQLDEAGCTHLSALAQDSGARAGEPAVVRPGVQHLLDATTDAPARVRNSRHDAGQLDLDVAGTALASAPGLEVATCSAAPGAPTADALELLTSWADSPEHLPTADRHHGR